MKLERVRHSVFRLTLHAYELTALIAAARLVAEKKGDGELPAGSVEQLRKVLTSYDQASGHVKVPGSPPE